jgi:NitT/TauT family transport system permease protein
MPSTDTQAGDARIDAELSGLDALELPVARRRSRGERVWAASWPKLLAVAIFLVLWQAIVWSGWKPEYLLPGPVPVFEHLFDNFGVLMEAAGRTLLRGVEGFTLAVLIGAVAGALIARSRILRSGVGSMLTGLQTMPSVAWFPLAILVLHLSEGAILFVVVLGAAPSVANGLINGIDNIPPLLLRAGRVLGARGPTAFRHVILPAALPSFVGGLKQGWAFAWRSLLAGELIAVIPGTRSLGVELNNSFQFSDTKGVLAAMVVIFALGVMIDGLLFGTADRVIRRRHGLVDESTA